MRGTLAPGLVVGGCGTALALQVFLQAGLGVLGRRASEGHRRQFIDHIDADEVAGSLHALVEIDGGYDCLDCGGEHRILVAPAGGFDTASHQQQVAQPPATGYLGQDFAADQPRAGLGQLAFVGTGELAVEVGRHGQLEDGVAEEL